MRLLKIGATAVLTVTLLFSPVLAVGSPVKGDGPEVVSATDSAGNDITANIVTTRLGTTSPIDAINSSLSRARNDVSAAGEKPGALKNASGATLAEDLKKAMGDDVNVDDLKFAEIFDASYVVDNNVVAPNGAVTMTVKFTVPAGMKMAALHSPSAGVWEIVGVYGEGTTVTTTSGLSPFAFVTTSLITPAPEKGPVKSPQTGEYVTKYVLLAAAALCVAGVVCVKRAKKSSVK